MKNRVHDIFWHQTYTTIPSKVQGCEKLEQLVYELVSIVHHKTNVFFEDRIVRPANADFIFLTDTSSKRRLHLPHCSVNFSFGFAKIYELSCKFCALANPHFQGSIFRYHSYGQCIQKIVSRVNAKECNARSYI